jgi:hypothetical protein
MESEKTLAERKWETNLERRINERINKRKLCQIFNVDWNELFEEYAYENFKIRLTIGLRVAKEKGLDWKPSYVRIPAEKMESYLSGLAEKRDKVKGKISLTEAADELGISTSDLNRIRIRGYLQYERIGTGFYFSKEVLRSEIEKPEVRRYLDK